MAADSLRLRQAVREALEQGFQRDIPAPDEDEEVDLVLRDREEAEKKALEAAGFAFSTLLQRLSASISGLKKR
jgi:hypothetical protein